jgi:hypothetical protein
MLTNGLSNILPVAFVHTALYNRQWKKMAYQAKKARAEKDLQEEAAEKLARIRRDYGHYPSLYGKYIEEYHEWYAVQLERRINNIKTEEIIWVPKQQ